MGRSQERQQWLRNYAERQGGYITLYDGEMIEQFCETFPEARNRQKERIFGPQTCPMLSDDARQAFKNGLFTIKSATGMREGPGAPRWSRDYWIR